MSERPGKADDLDGLDGGDCRPTVVPGMPGSSTISDRPSAVRDVIKKAKAEVEDDVEDDGPKIEVSVETDVGDMAAELVASEWADVGDDVFEKSMRNLEGASVRLPNGDLSPKLREELAQVDEFTPDGVVDPAGDEGQKVTKLPPVDLASVINLDEVDFGGVLDGGSSEGEGADCEDPREKAVEVEDDIHFEHEGGEEDSYVENEVPTLTSVRDVVGADPIGVGPPLEGDTGFVEEKPKSQMVTVPPPASEVDRILGRMEEQLAQAVVRYNKAERQFRKAESDKLALEEAINAFHGRNKYCEDDLVALVRGEEMDKAERLLDVHGGFFSKELALVLISTREGLRLFIDHIDSFSVLGASFIEELAKVELDLDQITSVLKSLRNREKSVFFPKDEELEDGQLDSFVEVFLQRLIDLLRS